MPQLGCTHDQQDAQTAEGTRCTLLGAMHIDNFAVVSLVTPQDSSALGMLSFHGHEPRGETCRDHLIGHGAIMAILGNEQCRTFEAIRRREGKPQRKSVGGPENRLPVIVGSGTSG